MIIREKDISVFHPIHVQVEVTWKCNWRCVHCYQDDHRVEMLSTENLKQLFRELAANGTMHIIITGGEPLVRKDILEILEFINGLGMGITLYTNGHLVDETLAKKLASLIAVAELSVLGGTAEIHDDLSTVKGSFQKTMSAVQHLKNNGVRVVLKTPVLRPAMESLKLIEQKAMQLGVEWFADPEISRSYAGDHYPLQYQLSFSELQTFFKSFPQFNPNTGFNTDPGIKKGICLAGRQYCFIDAKGNVYPCLNFKSACDVRQMQGKPSIAMLGNILKEPFSNIWSASALLHQIRDADSNSFTICSGCKSGRGCSPCMALNYEENGELFKPAPSVCKMTKAAKLLSDPGFIPASEMVGR